MNTIIQFFSGNYSTFVVIRRIGIDSLDTEKIGSGNISYGLGKVLSIATPTEIGNKNFTTCIVLDSVIPV